MEICILTGGQSNRMGRDKARVLLGGRSLLARVRAVAESMNCPARLIRRDRVPGLGPLGGIATAWAISKADRILFLSCDMPFVTAGLLNRLREFCVPEIAAVFALSRSPGFPFILRRRSAPVVEQMLQEGARSLKELARRLDARTVAVPEIRAMELWNINTPDDLEQARRFLRSRPPGADPALGAAKRPSP